MLDNLKAIEVYSADIGVLDDEKLYNALYEFVSPARIERVKRMYRDTDRKLSILSEALLIYALKHNGYDKALEFETGKNGKPYLKDRKFNFNISHSGSRAVCAITDMKCDIGCDIEAVTEYDSRIAKRIFDEREQASLAAASEDEVNLLFTELWTKKESYIKCTGLGLASVSSNIGEGYAFLSFNGLEGYKLTLCVNCKEEPKVDFIEVTNAMLIEICNK